MNRNRRRFIVLSAASAFALCHQRAPADESKPIAENSPGGVTAPEDLMREHGVLGRLLLVYEEGVRRIRAQSDISGDVFREAATMIRDFLEQYHEALEEKYVFPEFEKRGRLVELVRVLREQHQAGRRLTESILRLSAVQPFATDKGRQQIVDSATAYVRAYRPHRAREETVLFPAMHDVFGADQLAELGERFEEQEEKLLGPHGFDKMVDRVAGLEKRLGIYDLSQFTPRASR